MAIEQLHDTITEILVANSVTIEFSFVPFSKSRNKAEKCPSLNYKVSLKKGGREVLKTDYSMGSGHCQANKSTAKPYEKNKLIAYECENGRPGVWISDYKQAIISSKKPVTLPKIEDVIHCLLMDADVLEYGDFESWASDLGYDVDSRKAEKTYTDCLKQSLKFNQLFRNSDIERLRELFQDY